MSGHSKWSKIKNVKAGIDAKKGQFFTKMTREIMVAVREGGPSPDSNFRLRLAIQRSKDGAMPNENIERAIKKASGGMEATNLTELAMEGYGPGGIAIMVAAVLLFYALLCLWWQVTEHRNQAFTLPPLTMEEKAMIKRAIRQHGDYLITREQDGRFIMHRDGRRIRL